MHPRGGVERAIRWAGVAVVVSVSLAGCIGQSAQGSKETTETSVAVTAPDPAREAYNKLVSIEQHYPDRFTPAMRTRFPWAFDPQTGRLAGFKAALAAARNHDGCAAACVQASYTEMLDTVSKR